jgi:hypothetical protein
MLNNLVNRKDYNCFIILIIIDIIIIFNPATFQLNACTKSGKWAVFYLILSLCVIFVLDFRTVLTVWYAIRCSFDYIYKYIVQNKWTLIFSHAIIFKY